MANILNANPIVIVANLASYKAAMATAGFGTSHTLIISQVAFLSTVTTDTVSITDPISGNLLALVSPPIVASVPIVLDFSAHPVLWRDFAVAITLTGTGNSGLYIYTAST